MLLFLYVVCMCQGIYIGDITDASSLTRPMRGVKSVVILTSSFPLKDPNRTWYFPEGGRPIDIDWKGSNNQARTKHSRGRWGFALGVVCK